MIKDLNELKEFIAWAKIEKVKKVRLGEIEIELSDLALIPELSLTETLSEPVLKPQKNQELTQDKDDEDLLFYSSN